LGVAGAGVVLALQDVIASFAGWCAIGFSRLYTVGDRVQIADTRGDVIDISILRTTMLETGNWVSGDLHNGELSVGVRNWPNLQMARPPTSGFLPTSAGSE
jgi:small-conductance mechanosensitive channel